jgi:hypothetical protein
MDECPNYAKKGGLCRKHGAYKRKATNESIEEAEETSPHMIEQEDGDEVPSVDQRTSTRAKKKRRVSSAATSSTDTEEEEMAANAHEQVEETSQLTRRSTRLLNMEKTNYKDEEDDDDDDEEDVEEGEGEDSGEDEREEGDDDDDDGGDNKTEDEDRGESGDLEAEGGVVEEEQTQSHIIEDIEEGKEPSYEQLREENESLKEKNESLTKENSTLKRQISNLKAFQQEVVKVKQEKDEKLKELTAALERIRGPKRKTRGRGGNTVNPKKEKEELIRNLSMHNVRLEQSKIKGAGIGAFATTSIRKGTKLFQINGKPSGETITLTKREIAKLPLHVQTVVKAFLLPDGKGCRDIPKNGLSFALGVSWYLNTAKGTGMEHNVEFGDELDAFGFNTMITTRRIKEGEELLLSYDLNNTK